MALKLTKLARKTLEEYFKGKKFIPDDKTKEKYKKKKACFVTLTENGGLKGCVGCLGARQELWKELQENVLHAAFHDIRFCPLQEGELSKIKIEVSVLSLLKKINFVNEKDLLIKVNKRRGLILKKGMASATFLPQVWMQISDKISFLEHLSVKASLNRDAWKQKGTEFFCYTVEAEGE